MNDPRPTAFDEELKRRLAILARGEEADRRLPMADAWVLAAITAGSFAIVLIVQAV